MTDLTTLSDLDLIDEFMARRDLAETAWLDFCEAAYRLVLKEAWTKKGYVDAAVFFEEYAHVSYRKLRRSLTIYEGLMALPAGEQEEAKDALVAIGQHKSEVLSAVLKEDPAAWRQWTAKARRLSLDGLRAEANAVTGNGRAVAADKPGDRFLRAILNHIPEDARAQVEETFAAGKVVAQSDNAVAIFLAMVKEVAVEWQHRAAYR